MLLFIKNKIKMIILLLTVIGLLSGCGQAELIQIDGKTMGTYYNIKYVSTVSDLPSQDSIKEAIDTKLETINQQMSTYLPDAEIVLFNQSRLVNVPFKVSPEVIKVVKEAKRIAALTDNTLDITAFPLVNIWGFGPSSKMDLVPPSDEEITQRLAWIGIDKLKVDDNGLTKTIPQLAIDLSAIAKGYGVDAIGEYLESLGITDYLVDIGGEVRARGKNQQGKLWRIAIEKPTDGLGVQVQRVIELDNMSIATSGDYRNYFDSNGKHYSHTIDPKTGYPIVNGITSISVITPNCMTADGFSTAFGVLGPEKTIEIADRLHIAVFMIIKTEQGFEERHSKAFEPYL